MVDLEPTTGEVGSVGEHLPRKLERAWDHLAEVPDPHGHSPHSPAFGVPAHRVDDGLAQRQLVHCAPLLWFVLAASAAQRSGDALTSATRRRPREPVNENTAANITAPTSTIVGPDWTSR